MPDDTQPNVWIIEPRDPLLVRDGRPFDASPGARADSLDFPFPSTTTGAVRSRALQQLAGATVVGTQISDPLHTQLLNLEVRGPLLARLGSKIAFLAPAPADCLVLGDNDVALRVRQMQPDTTCATISGGLGAGVSPIAMTNHDKGKPFKHAPRFWHWKRFEDWLLHPTDADNVTAATLGYPGPAHDERTHLQISPGTRAAEEGKLFMTRALEFAHAAEGSGRLSAVVRFGLAVATSAAMSEGINPMGGERRLVRWRKTNAQLPEPPTGLREAILKNRACRIVLLTPSYFDAGWKPDWLLTKMQTGITLDLCGAAVDRAQTVSGWDLRLQRAKPSRRLAPAGSVYFVKLAGDDAAITKFIDRIWMQCISDDEQARRDGFGLAVAGTWDAATSKGGIS